MSSAIQFGVAAIFALVAALFIAGSAPDTQAGAPSLGPEQRPLSKEWVWKKAPLRFDHMYSVPY